MGSYLPNESKISTNTSFLLNSIVLKLFSTGQSIRLTGMRRDPINLVIYQMSRHILLFNCLSGKRYILLFYC